jgi:hypothetical protein
VRDLPIGESFFFRLTQQLLWYCCEVVLLDLVLHLDERFNLLKKPFVNLCNLVNCLQRDAHLDGVVNVEQPVPGRVGQAVHELVLVPELFAIGAKPIAPDLQ